MVAGARVAPVGHLVSLTDGTVRVATWLATLLGFMSDFVEPPHAAPRSREIACGSAIYRSASRSASPSWVSDARRASPSRPRASGTTAMVGARLLTDSITRAWIAA